MKILRDYSYKGKVGYWNHFDLINKLFQWGECVRVNKIEYWKEEVSEHSEKYYYESRKYFFLPTFGYFYLELYFVSHCGNSVQFSNSNKKP